MKATSLIFWLLLAASVVAYGVLSIGDVGEARRLAASREKKQQDLKVIREETMELGLKYRGYQKGLSDIPDSLRAPLAGITKKKGDEYHKRLFKLEREIRETERLIRKDDRAIDEVYSSLKRRLILFGGAAVVFLAGALITRRAAIRS
jgi:hypothetical protein